MWLRSFLLTLNLLPLKWYRDQGLFDHGEFDVSIGKFFTRQT